jgi:AbrB family looped-hinge helix DNA binding protein
MMSTIATTKLSSKGQVVIPELIRKKLGLEPGMEFVVLGDKDVVVLRTIKEPSIEDFDQLLADARRHAREVGLKRSDIARVIREARAKE